MVYEYPRKFRIVRKKYPSFTNQFILRLEIYVYDNYVSYLVFKRTCFTIGYTLFKTR